jgi:hypothetical protein
MLRMYEVTGITYGTNPKEAALAASFGLVLLEREAYYTS